MPQRALLTVDFVFRVGWEFGSAKGEQELNDLSTALFGSYTPYI